MKFSTILAMPLLFVGLPGAAMAQVPQAQPMQMVPRPTPDADALAAAMRRLGANPRDLSSLIEAGELSLKLGDPTAAAALFRRAEIIDPMNGRVKAGMARILVQQERPGEALRFFDQAAGYGLDVRSFAGDRGLAYDLIGEQTRAQRDYRLALAAGPQEEVQRRYALSLAISGKKDEALKQIDPLLRQSDRGAWRTRAFILAMGGDQSGATDIATRMMPPGMATGLQPFFKTLPSLGPVDRAFAVHFGEIRATPARLADARLAPALPALPPEPAAARVTLAQAAAPVLRADVRKREARERRQSARDRRRAAQQRVQVANAARAAAALPPAATLPEAPRYGSVNGVTFAAPREVAQAVPAQPTPAPAPTPTPTPTPTQTAAAPTTTTIPAATIPAPTRAPAAPSQLARVAIPTQQPVGPNPTPTVTPTVTGPRAASPQTAAVGTISQPVVAAVQATPRSTTPSVLASAPPPTAAPSTVMRSTPAAASPAPPPTPKTMGAPAPTPGFSAAVPAADRPISGATVSPTRVASAPSASVPTVMAPASTLPAQPARSVATTPAPVAPRMSEDSILARIVAGITIPPEELGNAPIRQTPIAPAPTQSKPVATSVAPKPTPTPASTTVAPTTVSAAAPVPAKVIPKPTPTPTLKPTPKPSPTVDPKVAARKAAADKKAAAAKKLADAEKAAAAKKLADEKKAAKADPARIWVQVAGGANAGDLAKAWGVAKGKAAALSGKTAYSTPLRATNRVVTGPFKTDAEAQAMVNTLAKQGVSAFTFTSEVGQKVTRLPLK